LSIPWNTSLPTLERNGRWHSPLYSNAHSESSDYEPLQTTRPIVASAKPIAQRDVITEITCNASSEHDAEQHAQDMGQRSVDGSTPRELLPLVHIWPDPAAPKYKNDADGTTVNTPHPTLHNPTDKTTLTADETNTVIADLAAGRHAPTAQAPARTITETTCKTSSAPAVE